MTSLWLAWQEARARRWAFVLSAAFVAAAVSVSAGLELAARAREAAVSAQMDTVAPGIRVVPAGVTSTALRRLEFGDGLLPEGLTRQLAGALSGRLRRLEGRFVVRHEVGGVVVPVIGVEETDTAHAFLGVDEPLGQTVAVGHAFANRVTEGEALRLWGRSWTVARILPERGTLDDRSVFVALDAVQKALNQAGRINELRLYPHTITSIPRMAATIREQQPSAAVFESAARRGEAEADTESSLARFRGVLQVLTILAAAMALFVSALLEARDRNRDIAMLVAMGARSRTVAGALVGRFAMAAVIGSIAGLTLATAAVLFREPQTSLAMPWPWGEIGAMFIVAILASATAVAPAVGLAVMRDHAQALQI